MHAGCMRDALANALAEHGAVMQAAMHQALQTIAVPPSIMPALVLQGTIAQAAPAAFDPAAAATTALQPGEQQQQPSTQPGSKLLANAVRSSDVPTPVVQQQMDSAQEQVDATQQRYGGISEEAAVVAVQAVLQAPQLHASMVSRVPETSPAQLPSPSSPYEAHGSGVSAGAIGAGKPPALLTYSRTRKRGSPSSADPVHPDAASNRDAKRTRRSDTGTELSSPSPRKLCGGKRPAHAQQELSATLRRVKSTTQAPASPMAESKVIQAYVHVSVEEVFFFHETVQNMLRLLLWLSLHGKAHLEIVVVSCFSFAHFRNCLLPAPFASATEGSPL